MQVPLNLKPTIAYEGKSFIEHSGATEALKILRESDKGLFLVRGKPRSGKTHLLISLMNNRSKYIEAKFFDRLNLAEGDLILIDDFDQLLESYQNERGLLVSFLEDAKNSNSKIIASLKKDDLELEPHVGSRIRSGIWLEINDPTEEEIPELFDALAKQRGIIIGGRKRQFALSRMGRDIASLEQFLDRLVLLTVKVGKGVQLSDIKIALTQ